MDKKKFDSFPSALDALKAELRSHVFSPAEYYIVLTPDRYTQSVESALFSRGGSLDTEVLTLSRLAGRVIGDKSTLSREGCVMITARALAAVKPQLTYYSRAAAYDNFARDVYETLGQIAASDADIMALNAEGPSEKLSDLAIIKREYDRLKAECMDSADRITALIKAVPSDKLIASSHVYAIGYSDITRLNARALGAIAERAKSFTMFEADTPGRRKSMTVAVAPDRVSEYKYIASYIHDYIYKSEGKGRYSDISVVCANPRVLTRILKEYDIPMYKDETEPLSSTEAFNAIALLTELSSAYKASAVDCDAVVALAKNPFSGCDPNKAELLQNATAERALKFVPKEFDFKRLPGGECAERIVSLVGEFCSFKLFSDAVNNLLEKAEFEKTAERMSARTDTVSPIRALTELLSRYGAHDFDIDAKAFISAAQAVNVNSLPRERDSVTVTLPQTLRLTKCKRLIVADFNDGEMPVTVSPSGLLDDSELDVFRGAIEPTVAQLNRRARAELKAVVYNAEEALCMYSEAGGSPSSFIPDLAENIERVDVAEKHELLKNEDDAEEISFFAPTAAAARELAARKATKHSVSIAAAADEAEHTAAEFVPYVPPFSKKTVSPTELSRWFYCPYSRFLDQAVGIRRRQSGLSAPDFGTVVHKFMELFIERYRKTGKFDTDLPAVQKLVERAAKECNVEPTELELERMVLTAADFATHNAEIIEAGDYNDFETETEFEADIGLSGGVMLKGKIDRIDRADGYARIIDYKTGSTAFDLKKCENGTDMQLPLYAAVCEEAGDYVTGMFYIKPRSKYSDDPGGLSGALLRDVDVVLGYDRSLAPGEKSKIVPARINKKPNEYGEPELSGNKSLLSRERFERLIENCVLNTDMAVKEIASGYIDRLPLGDACEKCRYFGICTEGVSPRVGETGEDGE